MNTIPIIIERTFDAPIATVWRAISEKEIMKEWYFDLAEFKPEIGFKFQFFGGYEEGVQYLHLCEVLEVIPESKLKYSWKYDGFEGISYVTFELFKVGNQTKIILTHEGLESFPQENADFAKANFVEGWNHILGTSLKEYLNPSTNK